MKVQFKRNSRNDECKPPPTRACIRGTPTGPAVAGFGGNLRPSSVFPTLVSTRHEHQIGDELPPFMVGPGAEQRTRLYDVAHPMKRGAISDWVAYEQLMYSCLCECALPIQLPTRSVVTLPSSRLIMTLKHCGRPDTSCCSCSSEDASEFPAPHVSGHRTAAHRHEQRMQG